MGSCSGKNKRKSQSSLTTQIIAQNIPSKSSNVREKVLFFDSTKISTYIRQHKNECFTLIEDHIRQMQLQDQADECLVEIKNICTSKIEVLLRSYNHYTDQALMCMQKVLEYYQNCYLPYSQTSQDTPEVKRVSIFQSLQLSLENIIIVNCLLEKNFNENDIWWTTEYYKQRTVAAGQSHTGLESSTEHTGVNDQKVQPKYEIIKPFLNFVQTMKFRLNMSNQLKQSLGTSIQGSTLILQNHLNTFYKNMKDDLAISVVENEQVVVKKKLELSNIIEDEVKSNE